MFKDFDDDGNPLFDSKEDAINHAKMKQEWQPDVEMEIYVQREYIPLRLARLLQGTFLEFIAYEKYKEKT